VKPLPPTDSIASFDSASALLSALSRTLAGQNFPASRAGAAPGGVGSGERDAHAPGRRVYAVTGDREGVPPDRLGDVDLDAVAAWAAKRYPARRYPAVLIGSSNGAMVHLAAAAALASYRDEVDRSDAYDEIDVFNSGVRSRGMARPSATKSHFDHLM
jgi:hypothetical protein